MYIVEIHRDNSETAYTTICICLRSEPYLKMTEYERNQRAISERK